MANAKNPLTGEEIQYPTTWGGQPLKMDDNGNPAFLGQNLSEDNALPWQKYFDKNVAGTEAGSDSLVTRQLGRDANYFEGARNRGLEDGNFSTFQPRRLSGGAGPTGNAMSQAIASKYQKDVSSSLGALRTQNKVQSELDSSRNLTQANKVLADAQQRKNQNFLEQYDFQMKRYNLYMQHKALQAQAEASAISNFLGFVGMAGKMASMGGG